MNRKSVKEILSLALTLVLIFSGFSGITKAEVLTSGETILIDEGFDYGTTAPAGWTFQGVSSSAAYFGLKAPSLIFNTVNDSITTPAFSNSTKLSFWIKGLQNNLGALLIVYGYKEEDFKVIDVISQIPANGTVKTYNIDNNISQIRFTSFNSNGEIAIDDVKVTREAQIIVPVSGITLNSNTGTVEVGKTITVTPTVSPENATNKKVLWASSNNSIAAVNNGVIRGIGVGTATITATTEDGGKAAAYSVTVVSNTITPIANVKIDENKDNTPDFSGKSFTVYGRVTAVFDKIFSSYSTTSSTTSNNTPVYNPLYYTSVYVQDETGGILVSGVMTKDLVIGNMVKVTGVVGQHEGETRLAVTNENIEKIDINIGQIDPKTVTTMNSMLEENEGLLVKTEGRVTKIQGNSLYINDGTGEARVFDNRNTWIFPTATTSAVVWNPDIKVGDTVSVTGIVSQDSNGYRIRIRNAAEVVKKVSSTTPETKAPAGSIRINKQSVTITVGKSETITILSTPAAIKEVKFDPVRSSIAEAVWMGKNSKNTKLITIKGLQAGTTTIKIIVDGKPVTCVVNVISAKGKKK